MSANELFPCKPYLTFSDCSLARYNADLRLSSLSSIDLYGKEARLHSWFPLQGCFHRCVVDLGRESVEKFNFRYKLLSPLWLGSCVKSLCV